MRRPGRSVRAVVVAALTSGKMLPRNADIAAAAGCDECTVRRVLGEMQDAGEIVVMNKGMRRVVEAVRQ